MEIDPQQIPGGNQNPATSSVSASSIRLPGASSLVEQLNKPVLVCLRDGKNIIGILRSFDQFANLVLENAVERVVVEAIFGDIPIGIYVIRGENVMLVGEMDHARDVFLAAKLRQVSQEEILRAQKAQKEDREAIKRKEKFEWPLQDDYI
eukprot:CAMPEP_0184694138 /NCGR_PEP_ID=MMETSP0313-20130426/2187_1 /TAXON_ID=2792 /ORGANISM="Porphyridium aerugineum, Strain SAG 1380-2" /LENGTH=149 /DNA_ID=CAMNT_0027152373 /DNA_START=24 /DNA_END=473 /DNA_ORIENTATION=-